MRGLVALSLVLTLASLSGCVSLVEDGSDPDLENAAADADRALDEYQAKAGHIAGLVSDAQGAPLAGALVDLVGIESDLATDTKGHFAFLDLKPGVYTLVIDATGFQSQQSSVDVTPGQFARPEFTLEPVTPAAYFTVEHFEGYQEIRTLGFALMCYCDFEGDLAPEGLTEAVLEAQMGDATAPYLYDDQFEWLLESWDAEGSNTTYAEDGYYNYGPSPLHVLLDAEDFAPAATHYALHVDPYNPLQTTMSQSFDGYLSIFYNGPAPEDYTAYAIEE